MCVQTFTLAVITEPSSRAPQFVLMDVQPFTKPAGVPARTRPVPQPAFAEPAVYLTRVPPTTTTVPAEVDKQEHEPEGFFYVSSTLFQYRGL
jgi:hypothetical protein